MQTRFLAACELKNNVRTALVAVSLLLCSTTMFAAEGGHDQSIGEMILGMGWPVANFIIFVGVIYYFGNGPLKEYLATRSATIRKDLVEAAELKAAANAQLATIEQKLQALPGELTALRARGADDIVAEEKRIAAAAEADRERLLEQTRREIDLQVRLARKDILEHAANLSVQLATERIKKETTAADQDRLVDNYLLQVSQAPGPKPQDLRPRTQDLSPRT